MEGTKDQETSGHGNTQKEAQWAELGTSIDEGENVITKFEGEKQVEKLGDEVMQRICQRSRLRIWAWLAMDGYLCIYMPHQDPVARHQGHGKIIATGEEHGWILNLGPNPAQKPPHCPKIDD